MFIYISFIFDIFFFIFLLSFIFFADAAFVPLVYAADFICRHLCVFMFPPAFSATYVSCSRSKRDKRFRAPRAVMRNSGRGARMFEAHTFTPAAAHSDAVSRRASCYHEHYYESITRLPRTEDAATLMCRAACEKRSVQRHDAVPIALIRVWQRKSTCELLCQMRFREKRAQPSSSFF